MLSTLQNILLLTEEEFHDCFMLTLNAAMKGDESAIDAVEVFNNANRIKARLA